MLYVCNSRNGISYESKKEVVPTLSYVSWGTTGQLVRDVQQALKNRGYYKGNVDGIYGTGTYNAIVSFQKDNALTADGIAGTETLRALEFLPEQVAVGLDRQNKVILMKIYICWHQQFMEKQEENPMKDRWQ